MPTDRPTGADLWHRVARGVTRRPRGVLGIALLITIGAAVPAARLHIDTDFSSLLPPDHPSVAALAALRDVVGGESHIAVVIESPAFDANRAFADAFAARAPSLEDPENGDPFVTAVEYRRDIEFLERHALYFATDAELDRVARELRFALARARLRERPSLRNLVYAEAARADGTADGSEPAALADVLPTRYPISPDSTILVLRFAVSGAQTDIGFIRRLVSAFDGLADALDPPSYHTSMQISFGERVVRQLYEAEAIIDDVRRSLLGGITAVMVVVLAYFSLLGRRYRTARTGGAVGGAFRTPAVAALLAVPLVMSLVWTFGLARLLFGSLNLMTSTLGLILFGLGVDYGIHLYARYLEARAEGDPGEDAPGAALVAIGPAITFSALTTAAPLFALTLADFRGFSEFGALGGLGVLLAAASTLTILPALLAIVDRGRAPPTVPIRHEPVDATALRGTTPAIVASVLLLLSLPFTTRAVGFEYDFASLEPRYDAYDQVNRKFRQVYPRRGNPPAYLVVDGATEAREVARAVRDISARDSATPTVARVETWGDRFPMDPESQRDKLARIADIRALADDPLLVGAPDDALRRVRRAASTEAPLSLDGVPTFISRAFAARDGSVGRFVLAYPSVDLSDGRSSMAFADDVGTVTTDAGRTYHAASTSIVAASMLRTMLRESPWMIAASLIVIGGCMLAAFRSARHSMVAMVPLVAGVGVMLVVLNALGMRITFYSLAAIPAILGIGNDGGVHLVHRYRQARGGSIRHVRSAAGEPVAIGGITTMMGFSGLLFTNHPGLISIGQLAIIGIGAVVLTSLVLVPALLSWMETR